jgi:hypothetical protein
MKYKFYLLIAFFLILFYSCKDASLQDITESIQSAEDNSISETEFSNIFEYVNSEGDNNFSMIEKSGGSNQPQGLFSLLPDCATVSFDSVNRTITINFGTTNCLCKDGNYRQGKLSAQFNKKPKEIGATVLVSLIDYYVNDKKVTGTKTYTHTDTYKWTVNVQDASVTTDNGTISWNSVRVIEKLEGGGTLTPYDDVYLISGTASGVNRQGNEFTVTIDTPLKKVMQAGCIRNFVSGVWTLVNKGGATMSLNYDPIGGEPCDKIAEVSINGKKKTITLR